VYVHCRGGIGRTGTTVGCYLARHGYGGEEALAEVNKLFQNSNRSFESSCSPETKAQMTMIQEWDE
jgi:protein-tyrosine phosphatase